MCPCERTFSLCFVEANVHAYLRGFVRVRTCVRAYVRVYGNACVE